jgi:hypothetical protein
VLTKSTHITLGRFAIVAGFSLKRFGIGFVVGQYGIDLDLGFIWLSLEY